MAEHQLILPKMGESVSEATIIKWLKQPGERIEEDEPVLEIATDKVDSDVPSPVAGILKEQLFAADAVVQVGQVLAVIATDGLDSVSPEPRHASTNVDSGPDDQTHHQPVHQMQEPEATAIPYVPVGAQDGHSLESKPLATQSAGNSRFYSPLVKNIAAQEGISMDELDSIAGSGNENRVTKQDILDYLKIRGGGAAATSETTPAVAAGPARQAPAVQSPVAQVTSAAPATSAAVPTAIGSDEIIEMDRMRRLIADHMVASVQTSPHVCSFVEADVTNLVNWRNKIKSAYEKREGEKITFTPVFIEAVSKALKDFPMVNVSVDGYNIIKKKNINIGMATALPSGNLIVPVIRNADQLSLVGLSKSVNDLAARARANKLRPDDTQGGTFTVTNVGAFGNITGTPIINQPQVAILAVGTIVKKPAVLETEHGDVIAIRHKMVLSLSYDHRVVDGSLGGRFVKRVADYLEAWDPDSEI